MMVSPWAIYLFPEFSACSPNRSITPKVVYWVL